MGRAIDMEKRQDDFDRRLKLVEDALEELVHTRVHHIDLHEETKLHTEETQVEKEKPKRKKAKKETVSA